MLNGTALITGASAGLGREFARLFARDGHDVVLVARSEAKLQELAEQLREEYGVQTHVVTADLSDLDAPRQVFRATEAAGLTVDMLVNNAGFGLYGPFLETDGERELEMIRVNVSALTHLAKLYAPGMVARGRGRIMNVASTAAFAPGPLMAVYYATKAYVLSFSEALAAEFAGSGVTVTAFCPGATRTDFQEVASAGDSHLFRSPGVMAAEPVARAGYDALMQGKVVAIPGVHNKVMAQSVRFLPRRLVRAATRAIMRERGRA